MEYIKNNYRDNKKLRDSFNELAEKTFGLNFENWYQNGYWKDNYNPYSVIIDGKVVSNVSVNQCSMELDGKKLKLIQLGTVMTDPDYRNKGYARQLMEEIFKDYDGKVDGIYLFANDTVLDFYPKFGFKSMKEYQYSKAVNIESEATVEHVPMDTKEDWDKVYDIITHFNQTGRFNMIDNAGLFMFYLSSFMAENVFYIRETDTYVIAEIEDDELYLDAVFSKTEVELEKIIQTFGRDIHRVILNFTPKDMSLYNVCEVNVDDTTLFMVGDVTELLENKKMMFQTLSHA